MHGRRIVVASLFALVVGAPQFLGGATVKTTLVVVALAAISAATAGFILRGRPHSRPLTLVDGVLLLGVLWTAAQCIPLPIAWVDSIAPSSAYAIRASIDALTGVEPSWGTITRAPAATRVELLKGAAICCAFFTSTLLAGRGRRDLVLSAAAISVAAMALTALLHAFLSAKSVWGVHRPVYSEPLLLAPLLNENHFGGFLAMGVPVMLGLGMQADEGRERGAWFVAAAIVGATAFLSLSRGAIAVLVGGTLLFVILSRRSRGRRARIVRGAALPVVGMLTLGAYAAADGILSAFDAGTSVKLDLIKRSLAFIGAEPWIGVGRGAFSVAFVEQVGTTSRFVHPENLLAQWGTEWGVIFGGLLAITLSVALLRAFRLAKSPAHVGGCVALLMLVIHNMVDFSLEMAGVAVVAAALLGAILTPPPPPSEQKRARGRRPRLRRTTLVVGVLTAVLLGTIGPTVLASDVEELSTNLRRQYRRGKRDAFAEHLTVAVNMHPSEPAFALLAGAEARSHRDFRAAPLWLNRAMQLAPGWSAPRIESAQMFLDVGLEGQSAIELREAATRELDTIWDSACPLVIRGGSSLVLAAAPYGPNRLPFLNRASRCHGFRTLASAQIDDAILAEDPEHTDARLRRARRLLAADKPTAALENLEALAEALPANAEVQEQYGRTLMAADRPEDALAHLESVVDRVTGDRSRLLEALAVAQARSGDLETARRTMMNVRRLGAGSPRRLAAAYDVEGSFEEAAENLGRALRAAEEAQRLDPREARLARIARLAQRLGDTRRALTAYVELCDRAGGRGPHCRARDALEGGSERRGRRSQP